MSINLGDAILYFKGDMSGLNSALGNAQKNVQDSMGNILQTTRAVGLGFVAFGTALVAPLGIAVKSAMDFEQALKNAVSVTGLTGGAAAAAEAQMSKLAMTLGQQTAFSAKEVANAFYDLNSKGFDAASMSVEELLPFLNLASATQSDLTDTTMALTATLKAYGFENSEAARVADVFTMASGKSAANMDLLGMSMPVVAAAAKATGVSFEETTSALSMLYDNGIRAETAATGLRNVMMDMTNGSKMLNDALGNVGLNVSDLDLKNNGLAGAFTIMKNAGMSATDIMAAFGKENGVVGSLMGENAGKVAAFTKELELNAKGTAASMAAIQLDSLAGQWKVMSGSLETVAISMGKLLIPAIKDVVMVFTPMLNLMVDFANANPHLASALLATVGVVGTLSIGLGALMLAVRPLVLMWTTASAVFGNVSGLTKSRQEMAQLQAAVAKTSSAFGGATDAAAKAAANLAALQAKTVQAGTSFEGLSAKTAVSGKEMAKAEAAVARTSAAMRQAGLDAAVAGQKLEAAGTGMTRLGAAANITKGSLDVLGKVAATLLWVKLISDVMALTSALWDAGRAAMGLAEVNAKLPASLQQITDALAAHGIAYDKEKVAAMETGQAISYLTALYGTHVKVLKDTTVSLDAMGNAQKQLPPIAKEVLDKISDADKEFATKVAKWNQDAADNQADNLERLSNMNRDFQLKLRDAGISLGDSLGDIRQKTADALTQITADWRKTQLQLQQSALEAQEEFLDASRDREQDHADNVYDTQHEANEKLTELNKKLKEAKTAEEKAAVQKEIDAARDEVNDKLGVAQREYEEAQARAARDYAQLQERAARKAALEEVAYQEKLAKERYRAGQEEAEANYNAQQATAKIVEQYQIQVAENAQAEARKARDTNQALDELQRSYQDALDAIQKEYQLKNEDMARATVEATQTAEKAQVQSAAVVTDVQRAAARDFADAWNGGGQDVAATQQVAAESVSQSWARIAFEAGLRSQGVVGVIALSFEGLWNKVASWFGFAGGGTVGAGNGMAHGGIVGMAGGGLSDMRTVLAGEEGPELAVSPSGKAAMLGSGGPGLYRLPVGTEITPARETAAMRASSVPVAASGGGGAGGGGNTVHINVSFPDLTIREEADIERISRRIAQTIPATMLGVMA